MIHGIDYTYVNRLNHCLAVWPTFCWHVNPWKDTLRFFYSLFIMLCSFNKGKLAWFRCSKTGPGHDTTVPPSCFTERILFLCWHAGFTFHFFFSIKLWLVHMIFSKLESSGLLFGSLPFAPFLFSVLLMVDYGSQFERGYSLLRRFTEDFAEWSTISHPCNQWWP